MEQATNVKVLGRLVSLCKCLASIGLWRREKLRVVERICSSLPSLVRLEDDWVIRTTLLHHATPYPTIWGLHQRPFGKIVRKRYEGGHTDRILVAPVHMGGIKAMILLLNLMWSYFFLVTAFIPQKPVLLIEYTLSKGPRIGKASNSSGQDEKLIFLALKSIFCFTTHLEQKQVTHN